MQRGEAQYDDIAQLFNSFYSPLTSNFNNLQDALKKKEAVVAI